MFAKFATTNAHQHTKIKSETTMFKSAALVLLSRSSHSFTPRRPSPLPLCFTHKMSTQTEVVSVISPPPVARREEDKVCFAGVGTADWDAKMPRQSNDSSGELVHCIDIYIIVNFN